MRQHILRLVIVFVLLLGIGFVVFSVIKDNSVFNMAEFINGENSKDVSLEQNIETLNTSVDSSFNEKVIINNFYSTSIEYFNGLLTNQNLDKQAVSKLKNNYRSYRSKVKIFNNSMISLISYSQDPEQNATELAGRKEHVNNCFVNVLLEKHNILNSLKDIVNSKIFGENNYDVKTILLTTNNMIIASYLENENVVFKFLNDTIIKTNDLVNANKIVNDNMIKFAIKYNEMGETTVEQSFKTYFQTLEASEDLSLLINYLNSEVYYEKN